MRKRIPSRLSFDLFPPVPEPRVYRYFENAREHPFRPRAAGVDLRNAWWLAELSMLAFSERPFIDIAMERAGLEPAGPPLDGPSTEAVAVQGDGFAAIAFRGTQVFLPGRDPLTLLGEIAEDILTDVCIPLVRARKPARGRVHRGFRNALDEIWKPLEQLVDRLRKEDRALWLTGLSLGGALAILAASRLPGIQGVYAFGAPLVGDGEFRANLPVRPVRFVHGSDLVTRVPVIAPNLPPRMQWKGLLPLFEPLGTYRPAGDTVAIN
ncbi:MAG TPA: lipase family protein, partial [Thermoanaerobaculia bacterium]